MRGCRALRREAVRLIRFLRNDAGRELALPLDSRFLAGFRDILLIGPPECVEPIEWNDHVL